LADVADGTLMSTMSNNNNNNNKYDSDKASSRRYTESPAMITMNGAPLPAAAAAAGEHGEEDTNWYNKFDVNSMLQDAPVDSIRQRTHVEREETVADSPVAVNDDDVSEIVDLNLVDGQVLVQRFAIDLSFIY